MDVQILSKETIKPFTPTPHHLKTFKPSFIDQTSVPFYIPLTVFYETQPDPEDRPTTHNRLKSSLSKTLNRYYPLAGRIKGMFSVECNDKGVSYTEAKTNFALSEFLEKPDLNLLNKFLPVEANSLEEGLGFQVAVQVSIFSSGGLVIGACFYHMIADIKTMSNFLKSWAGATPADLLPSPADSPGTLTVDIPRPHDSAPIYVEARFLGRWSSVGRDRRDLATPWLPFRSSSPMVLGRRGWPACRARAVVWIGLGEAVVCLGFYRPPLAEGLGRLLGARLGVRFQIWLGLCCSFWVCNQDLDLCGLTSDSDPKNYDAVDLELGATLFPPLPSFPADYLSNKARHFFSDGRDHHITRRFVLTPTAIAALREKAASAAVPRPSRVEALTGFISGRIVAGLGKPAVVSHAVNIRRRFEPPLPEAAFGNFTWFAAVVCGPPEEGEGPRIPDHVAAMREALDAVHGEDLRAVGPESAARVLNENLGLVVKAGIRVYKFSSWCNNGFYDLDFGWGRPMWVAHMGDAGRARTKYQLMFLEGRNCGEIELWVLLGEDEIGILDNDEEFLEFATPNPSILVKK
ncbi:HXXXD-type acyl-transferase family protein [Striga asiatica]|uniref:HXXXD-type acyl-transferase family protein n=1 Tax=Striga asiatica TaxID=4170 RepID=A0A5A7QRT3_STRAF|nr:HXXXD-type acyl-transferase family protein [Striga asiatica]